MSEIPNDFDGEPRDAFERLADHITGTHFLQLGALAGDATIWLHERFPQAEIIDVDTWKGSVGDPGHAERDWSAIRAAHHERCTYFCESWEGTTDEFFAGLADHHLILDFVYIDADHSTDSVAADAVNTFNHLKIGGVMAFDDYDYNPHWARGDVPRPAIDTFLNVYAEHIEVIERGPRQVWIKKIAEPHQ